MGNIFKERVKRFQELMREKGIDASVIRTLSTFIYFTGVKWLRPSLLIPAQGDPVVIVVKNEKELFMKKSWIKNVLEYQKTGQLMALVTSWIRKNGYKNVGFEYSIEKDSYLLFFELFKALNPKINIVDVRPLTMSLRMLKEEWEIENIKVAGEIAVKGIKKALDVIKEGKSELEVVGEITAELMRNGSEHPQVYVSATPRIHAEPFRDVYIEKGKFVSVVIGADYNNYYANITRSFFLGKPEGRVKDAIEAMNAAYEIAMKETKIGVKFREVEAKIESVYKDLNLLDYYIAGYTHGVGLLIEEDPITTIVVAQRSMEPKKGMVLAFVHSPLMLPEGVVKKEDTVIIGDEKINVTEIDTPWIL